jgi:electron transfer flavoprotein beta subunit
MKILVCISHVPDTTTKIKVSSDGKGIDKQGVQFVIGPYDDYALARAVELKESHGAQVTALNVGLIETEPTIRKALAIGADDAIRVNAEPTDTFFVANQIYQVAKDGGYDLILMGRETSDYNAGAVHGMVAELMGIPCVTPVMHLDIDGDTAKMEKEIEGGKEKVEAKLPLVAGCQEPIAEWKIPNMRGIMSARTKPLNVVEAVTEDSKSDNLGYEMPPAKGDCKMIDKDNIAELVNLLKNEAKVI